MKADIVRLHNEGYSYSQIVEKLGCSKGTIAWHCSKDAHNNYLAKQRTRRRADTTELKQKNGGKCQICGYSKCLNALHFHHKNPKTKLKVVRNNGRQYGVTGLLTVKNKAVAFKEAKKCILVCANCHSEIHAGITTI